MAAPLSAERFVAALRAEGVKVVEHSGWRTHNRNSKGSWSNLNGVVIHHTAGSNSLGLCWSGTGMLPGPLCHTHLAKNGTATMVGYGRANHAGNFAANAFNAMLNESSTHPRPDAAEPIDANARTYGIEIENLGNGRDPYPAVQYQAAVRWAAAICRAHGWSANSVIGHKEGTRRKIDPSFSMSTFRADVAERLKHPAGWNPDAKPKPPTEETDDMPHTLGLYDTTDRVLAPNKWTTIPVEKVDLLTGAKAYSATVGLTLSAPLGSMIQGRFYHLRTDSTRWEAGIIERTATAGATFADFHHEGAITASEKLRFEVAYFPVLPTDTKPIVISTARARGLYWK